MTKKRLACLFLVSCYVFFTAFTFRAQAEEINDTPVDPSVTLFMESLERHNLWLDADDYRVWPASVNNQNALLGASGTPASGDVQDYYLDLSSERLFCSRYTGGVLPADFIPAAYVSFDGGDKWVSFTNTPEGLDISTQLNRETQIRLTTNIDISVKPNIPKVGSLAEGTPGTDTYVAAVNGSNTYVFPDIASRPKSGAYRPEYATLADLSGEGNGFWTLTDVDMTTVQIALMDKSGYSILENPDALNPKHWATYAADDNKVHGIAVQDLDDMPAAILYYYRTKPGKIVYFVRTKPVVTGTITPASAMKKVGVPTVQKAPQYKLDYKKELIRVKAGAMWGSAYEQEFWYPPASALNSYREMEAAAIIAGLYDPEDYDFFDRQTEIREALLASGWTVKSRWCLNPQFNPNVTKVADNSIYTRSIPVFNKDTAKAGVPMRYVDTYGNSLTLYGRKIAVRVAATAKKPASTVQVITIEEESRLYQVDFRPSFTKGKLKLDKKYEVFDPAKDKWGKAPKEPGTYLVRIKNTAKYSPKTDKTMGVTVSKPLQVTFKSGSFNPKKPEKMGYVGYSVVDFPRYNGLVWVQSVKDSDGSPVSELTFDGTLTENTPVSSYVNYTNNGIQLQYMLMKYSGSDSGLIVHEYINKDVLINPTAQEISDIRDNGGGLFAQILTERDIVSSAVLDVNTPGLLTVTVKAGSATPSALTDFKDSLYVSLLYIPSTDGGVSQFLLDKFYGPKIPVTVAAPQITFSLPTIDGMGAKMTYDETTTSDPVAVTSLKMDAIEDALVISLMPDNRKVFLQNGAPITDASGFSVTMNNKTIQPELNAGVLFITIPKASLVGNAKITVTADGITTGPEPPAP